ncbi:MAG: hypothetical protein HYX32_11755 [Actinobacteria bacterium]|nr:hypothetical protein [Actinomycetota bacterium]
MPLDTVGANLAQLTELQRAFDAKAAQVDQLIVEISALVGGAGAPGSVNWQGRIADQFRTEWDTVYVKNLRQLVAALQEQARYVNENRRRSNLALNGIDA